MDLDTLNEQQKEAVITTEGPLLVLAGAGSGKTKVLTTRIVYLIEEKQVDPRSILAITFTNKAAKEMQTRVSSMLGAGAYNIQISTFHSFGLLIIRENYELLGYDRNFTILDNDDSITLIKKIMKSLNIDPSHYSPRAIKNIISNNKNELVDAKSYEKYAFTEFDKIALKIYRAYEEKLKSGNTLDFDDLLMLPIVLFKKHKEVLKHYQERFQYVLIDEYQDTNEAQYTLTKMISAHHQNLCVVGDESQSIYSFRGANYRNILKFEKDYKHAKSILLEKNYRSTQTILNVANDIIKNNTQRKEKNLWTDNDMGNKVIYNQVWNDREEAKYVVNEIIKLVNSGVSRNDIAILYRTNAQSRRLEEAILYESIPYKIVGSLYFYNRKEIKDLIAYLKVVYNEKDNVNLLRVINAPRRGIGAKTIERITDKAEKDGVSLFDAIVDGKELEFKKIIEKIRNESENLTLTQLVELVLDKSGLRQSLKDNKDIESEIRLENLEEFKTIAREFEEKHGVISLEEFLYEVSLVADVTEYSDSTDLLTLMTIHSAKGLEFDYVFIVGLEEKLFPHRNSIGDDDQIEEERRLCYVAVTRARKALWLVSARSRMIFGEINNSIPSRFIDEISEEHLHINNKKEEYIKTDDFTNMIDETAEYKIGDEIVHEQFGKGYITKIEGSVLTVLFTGQNTVKKLMKGHKMIRRE